MMKLTLYFFLIYQLAQLTRGFVPLQAINKLIFTPQGCIACYKAEANNFFQNLNRLSPNCAEWEMNIFNGISAKYFMAHICVYQTGTGYQSKYDTLQNYGNQVLRKFRKCLKDKLNPTSKNHLKNFTQIFENARITCESENFLEKGLKSIRQLYFEPPPPPSPPPSRRRRKQKSKQSQNLSAEELPPASKKSTPAIEEEKTPAVETVPLSNNLRSEHCENSQERDEIHQNEIEMAKMDNDVGTQEDIHEPSLNAVEEQDNVDATELTPLEGSLEAKNADDFQRNGEKQPNKIDALNEENDNGTYEAIPELSSNAEGQPNDVDETYHNAPEDLANAFEDQPLLKPANNLSAKIQEEKNEATLLGDSISAVEDHPSSTMTGNEPEKVQAGKVTSDIVFDPSENLETSNDQPAPHTSDHFINETLTSKNNIVPKTDSDLSDNKFTSPTTDNNLAQTQNDDTNPGNVQDSSSSQSAPLVNEETSEDFPQIQNDNSTAKVGLSLLPEDTSSDDLYDETSKDQRQPAVDNALEEVEENTSLTDNAISEGSSRVQDGSKLFSNEKTPENLYDVTPASSVDDAHTEIQEENDLVPLEKSVVAPLIDSTETNWPESSTENTPTPAKDSSIEDSPNISEAYDILKSPTIDDGTLEKSSETAFENEIESLENNKMSQDFLQSQNDDITSPDNIESTQHYDLSEPNSEDQPILDTTNTQTLRETLDTTEDQSASADDVATNDSLPVQDNDTSETTSKSSLDDTLYNGNPEEIPSTAPLKTKDPVEDLLLSQDNNLQAGDDNLVPLTIDTFSDNSLKTKSEEDIIPQISDSQLENPDTKSENEITSQINDFSVENSNEIERENSIITNASSEDSSKTKIETGNDPLHDSSSFNISEASFKLAENIPTPETITKPEQTDSATDNSTKFETSDDISKVHNEILSTDPATFTDDTTLSQDGITETTHQETVNDESNLSTLSQNGEPSEPPEPPTKEELYEKFQLSQNGITETTHQETVNDESNPSTLSQDGEPSEPPEPPTKEELYEKFQDTLTHFAIDKVLENDVEPVDEIFKDDLKNVDNYLKDEINYEDSVNLKTDSSLLDSNKLKGSGSSEQEENLQSTSISSEDESAKIEASDVPKNNDKYLEDEVNDKGSNAVDQNLESTFSSLENNSVESEVSDPSKNIENYLDDEINNKDSTNWETNSSSLDSSEFMRSDLNKEQKHFEATSSSEDDSAKTDVSDSSSSANHLLNSNAAETTTSPPSLKNLHETEKNDQNSENISSASDLISLENSPPQEDTPKLKLSEGSDSPMNEKSNYSPSRADILSPEQSELNSESEMNTEPDNTSATLPSTSDSTSVTPSQDHPFDSILTSENQTPVPQANKPQEERTESIEMNPATFQVDQASFLKNELAAARGDVSQETP